MPETKTKSLRKERKAKRYHHDAGKAARCALRGERPAPCESSQPKELHHTELAKGIVASLRIPFLERKIAKLTDQIEKMMAENNRFAAKRLAAISPSMATLRLWVERAAPADIPAEDEDGPW